MKPPQPEKTIVRFEIAPSAIGWILVTAAAVWVLLQLWVIGLLVVVALVLAGTFNPSILWMERRGLGRGASLLVLFIVLVLVAALLVFLTFPPLIEQLAQMAHNAPGHRERLIALLEQRRITQPLAHAVHDAGLSQLFSRLEMALLGYSSQAVEVIGYFTTTFVLAFYLLADGKRTQGLLYAVVPRDYHMRLARILHNMEVIVGGYMRGQLITSAAIGVFTLVLLLLCKVPNALSLALFAALADVIPVFGGLLATTPVVLSALSRGLPVTLGVTGAFVLYMQFENRFLIQKVYGHVLRLSPIMVALALLAGGTLLGMVGALLALPIAAGIQMMLEELRVEMPGDDSDDRSARARHAKTEAAYERMSAGSTAPEAGEIARNLALDMRDADALDAAKVDKGHSR